MITMVRRTLWGMMILGSMSSLYAVESWVSGDAGAVYWLGEDENTFERGGDERDNATALTGTATSTDEQLERLSGQWVSSNYDDYYLNTSSGDWVERGNTYTFNITGDNNEIMEIFDGYVRFDDFIDIAGETMHFPACFALPQATYTSGAKRYALSWKSKELYKLDWIPKDWSQQPPVSYPTLDDFVSAHNSFLYNDNTGENAGFRLDANLSDGSGDLVVLTWQNGTQEEGRKIGDWTMTTLPGQDANSSIKFTFTEDGFGHDEGDYMFATVYNNEVWLGYHSPEGTAFNTIEDEWILNEDAYNQKLAVIDAHKAAFAQLITCDLIDQKFQYYMDNAFSSSYVSFFGNMNYVMTDDNDNLIEAGEWSVQNGVVVRDEVENDINKTLNVEKVNFSDLFINNGNSALTHIESGRGTIMETKGQAWRNGQLPETDIPHTVTYGDIKGKKIDLTYQSGDGTDTVDIYMYPNMTYSMGASGNDVGVWKIENGVLVLDSYWLDDDGTPRGDTESWVFNDATHADIMIGGEKDANITINSIADLNGSETLPAGFTEAPVDNPFTEDDLLGKLVTIGDTAAPVKLYFYDDMTFKEEGYNDQGDPETVTGTWQVVEGAIVIDVVYSDDAFSNYIITKNSDGTIDIMDLVAGNTEKDSGVNVLDVDDIPSENGMSPAIIMYLLN